MKYGIRSTAIASAVLATVLAVATADAANQSRRTFQTAVGLCQGALPNFEGLLRKRPMAVANEGNSNSFISCAPHMSTIFSVGTATNPGADHVWVSFRNRTAAVTTVSCSMVTLLVPGVADLTIAKSVGVPAGGWEELQWDAFVDNGGTNFRLPAFSCNLPAGTEISYIVYSHTVDVGT